jgi:hypothetical protein
MITLYIDMPNEPVEGINDFAAAYARPAVAVAEGWTRWRIDLDLPKNEATVRPSRDEERHAFPVKKIG